MNLMPPSVEAGRHPHVRPEICETCARSHAGVLSLYRGQFLDGVTLDDCAEYELWLATQRERFHQMALASAEYLTRYHEWRGELAQARRYAQQQIDLEPLARGGSPPVDANSCPQWGAQRRPTPI